MTWAVFREANFEQTIRVFRVVLLTWPLFEDHGNKSRLLSTTVVATCLLFILRRHPVVRAPRNDPNLRQSKNRKPWCTRSRADRHRAFWVLVRWIQSKGMLTKVRFCKGFQVRSWCEKCIKFPRVSLSQNGDVSDHLLPQHSEPKIFSF